MTIPPLRRRALSAIALGMAIGLSACATDSGGSKPVADSNHPLPPRERVSKAVELLFQGKPAEARPLLLSAIKAQPTNDVARKLLAQIDTDPKVLLGDKAWSYRGRAGDTASSLAAAYLNDPQLFYALARYNQIDPPSQSLEGRTVLIPGEAPKRASAPSAVTAKPAPVKAGPKSAPPVTPQPAGRNPARAADLRAAGLVQMNKGAIDKAVGLLQQALSLDPGNPAIQRDLERAQRIRRTVRAR